MARTLMPHRTDSEQRRQRSMDRAQRFVSRYLTHFVGRKFHVEDSDDYLDSPEREEAQYEVLTTILRRGQLCPDPKAPGGGGGTYSVSVGGMEALTSNAMFSVDAVCFCDIPITDLGVHMDKYSQFGLSFAKPFLIERGVSPVFYLAMNALQRVQTDGAHETRREYFNRMGAEYSRVRAFIFSGGTEPRSEEDPDLTDLFARRPELRKDVAVRRLCKRLAFVTEFFDAHVLGYLKSFDDKLPFDSADNFYMEREWRATRRIDFSPVDLACVILPRRYMRRLRRDLPGLLKVRMRAAEDCRWRWWNWTAWRGE